MSWEDTAREDREGRMIEDMITADGPIIPPGPPPPDTWGESQRVANGTPMLTNLASYKGKPNVLFADETTGELVRYGDKGEEVFREEGQIPIKKPPAPRPDPEKMNEWEFSKVAIEKETPNAIQFGKDAAKRYRDSIPYSTKVLSENAINLKAAEIERTESDWYLKGVVAQHLSEFKNIRAVEEKKRLEKIKETPLGFDKDNRPVGKNNTTGDLIYQDTNEKYKGGPLKPLTDANAGNKIPDIGGIGTTPPGVRNEAALDGLNAGQAATVKGLVDYTIPLPSGMALRNPEWQAMLGRAAMYDTAFDAKEYPIRMALKRDFTSGNAAKNARSLNTAIHHLETLKKTGEELKNSSLQWWNAATNYGLEKLGDKRPTQYLNAATALSGELANVFKNTSGTDQEIKEWRRNISLAQSPEQIEGNADTVIQLIAGRLAALTNQWEKGMGKAKDFSLLSPKSREILSRIGANPDDLDPVAGGRKDISGSAGSGGVSEPSGTGNAPPASALKEGFATPFGAKGTWTLKNGVPTRVN